jgi:hypothetical protein
MRGRLVSERRERERARVSERAGPPAGPRGWAERACGRGRARAGRPVGPDRGRKRRIGPILFLFFFFK